MIPYNIVLQQWQTQPIIKKFKPRLWVEAAVIQTEIVNNDSI